MNTDIHKIFESYKQGKVPSNKDELFISDVVILNHPYCATYDKLTGIIVSKEQEGTDKDWYYLYGVETKFGRLYFTRRYFTKIGHGNDDHKASSVLDL
jgi:hypothetical protein